MGCRKLVGLVGRSQQASANFLALAVAAGLEACGARAYLQLFICSLVAARKLKSLVQLKMH